MPTDTYAFKVTIEGGDAIKQAQAIRKALATEFKQVTTVLDVGNIPEAKAELAALKKEARGVGQALTAGFRGAVKRLIDDITTLQEQVNAVVRGGAGPVEEALDNLGVMGLDALGMVDAGTTQATQKMARLTTEIRGAQAQIEALQTRVAELGARPMIPAGSMTGEVRTLDELFKEMTGSRMPQVRRMFRDMQQEMAPITAEIEKQAEAMRAEAAPAYEKARAELEELQAAHRQVIDQQSQLGRGTADWRALEEESKLYRQAIFEVEQEIGKLRSIMMGTGMDEEVSRLRYQQEQYLQKLAESTAWWRELTKGAGQHADVVEEVTKRDREAGQALAEMIAAWEQIRKLQTSISRGIGTMQRMGERVELPPGTEGTLATIVIAQRSLGESTELSTDQVVRQRKELVKLSKALEQASQAADGLDRVQRKALQRIQMVAERELTQVTKGRGVTTEEATERMAPILARVAQQTEAIKNRTLAELQELEAEGQRRQPFGWIVKAAQKAKSIVVGESIIPDMVTAINEWLARIGVEDPFTDLAMDAQRAAEVIETGLQQRLRTLSTEKAQQELEELQEELRETSRAIESQLVSTSQASQRYKKAFQDYAAEVKRVRGDDPAAMALLAQGKVLKGTGIRGEFRTMEIIDEGYQAISTQVQERQRLSQEEMAKLEALETQHTALRQAAFALERELAGRRVSSLEKAMGEALDTEDIDAYDKLNLEFIEAQDRLGELDKDIAFERQMITSKAVAAAEQALAEAKAQARRTVPTGAGTAVGGEVVMPTITQTQVKNARQYANAIRDVGQALTETRGDLPIITEAEQERVVATTRALAEAQEGERRLTAVKRQQLRLQELDKEQAVQVEIEEAKRATALQAQEAKKLTQVTKVEADAAAYEKKQQARAAAATVIEEERRLTAELKAEEARRTQAHQDEIRKRQQAERALRKAQLQPTPAELARYGGGRMGTLSWAVQEAQAAQMGMRMLTYDVQHLGRSLTIAGAAMTGPPILAMRRFTDYTRTTNMAASAMHLASEHSDELRHSLIEQSQALAYASPEEMASGMYMWATGVGAAARSSEELQKVIASTIPIQQLSYMQQLELAQATETTAGILAEYRMETSETARVVEVLDATADRTFAAVADLGEAFKFVGPVAHDLNISMEETAAAFGLLSDANIKGSMAGRAMRQLMIRLTKTTEAEDEALNQLLGRNQELGQSWRDIAFPEGEFIGLARWIDLLAAATESLNAEQRQAALSTISTANELPALTALVTRQIEAREHGINVIRAEEKILTGVLDAETQAYAEWEESVTGNVMNLESAHDSFERKVKETTESEAYQIDRLQRQWDAAIMAMGEHTLKVAVPALEKLTGYMDDITDFVMENPWIAEAVLAAGGVLTAVGVMGTTAANLLRIITVVRTFGTMIEGVKAAQVVQTAAATTQTTAAGTQVAAAETQIAAAQMQATTGQNLGRGLLSLAGSLGLVVAALSAEKYVVEKAGIPDWMQTQAARGTESYEQYVTATREITGGRLEPLTEEQWKAVRAGRELKDVVAETTAETETWRDELADCTDEMRSLKEAEREAKQEARDLGNELMQLPPSIGAGIAAFTEEELLAIDELEAYLRQRNELVERQNEDLAEMERDFQEQEADRYEDYLRDRAKLEQELREVTEDPLWETSEEVQRAREKEAEAHEEYIKRVTEAVEDYQRKLRNLREDHEDKMEDLEARRDAKGIIQERRRYARAKRDAGEHHQDTLDSLEERLTESVEKEREAIAQKRADRKADLEEKLRELDENYAEEAQKRREDFERQYAEKQVQNQKELQQLEKAHSEKLAKIMGWEQRLRDALRNSYIGREEDLRHHLGQMERMYLETYNMLSQLSPEAMTPQEYREWHERVRGHQAGGYAPRGLYHLGEAGREFVLSAPTTRAMERAIGPLNQARVLSMARSTYHGRLDIHVTADSQFSPDFAKQTEALIQAQIAGLAVKVAQSQPGGHRIH